MKAHEVPIKLFEIYTAIFSESKPKVRTITGSREMRLLTITARPNRFEIDTAIVTGSREMRLVTIAARPNLPECWLALIEYKQEPFHNVNLNLYRHKPSQDDPYDGELLTIRGGMYATGMWSAGRGTHHTSAVSLNFQQRAFGLTDPATTQILGFAFEMIQQANKLAQDVEAVTHWEPDYEERRAR